MWMKPNDAYMYQYIGVHFKRPFSCYRWTMKSTG